MQNKILMLPFFVVATTFSMRKNPAFAHIPVMQYHKAITHKNNNDYNKAIPLLRQLAAQNHALKYPVMLSLANICFQKQYKKQGISLLEEAFRSTNSIEYKKIASTGLIELEWVQRQFLHAKKYLKQNKPKQAEQILRKLNKQTIDQDIKYRAQHYLNTKIYPEQNAKKKKTVALNVLDQPTPRPETSIDLLNSSD